MTDPNTTAPNPETARLAALVRALAKRIEAGETTGLLGWEAHADGTHTRIVVGTVREHRYRLAGLALALAMEAAQPQPEAQP